MTRQRYLLRTLWGLQLQLSVNLISHVFIVDCDRIVSYWTYEWFFSVFRGYKIRTLV